MSATDATRKSHPVSPGDSRRQFVGDLVRIAGLGMVAAGCVSGEGSSRVAAPRAKPPATRDFVPSPSAFWGAFGHDWKANCLAWTHLPTNPVLPPSGAEWQSRWTANPDVLRFGNRNLLYYRGRGVIPGTDGREHDRIGVMELRRADARGLDLVPLRDGRPVIDVGPPGAFDDREVLDPATVVFGGKVWLYYSAIGSGPDSVGLAVSDDGVWFEKVGKVVEGRAPDVVVHEGRVVMLYQKLVGESYRLHVAGSTDGRSFVDLRAGAVFEGEAGGWDAQSVVTARLMAGDGWYYLLYGGSAYHADEPEMFGLARSRDLVTWERHPGNPVFGCGPMGAPDGGAIWFPALVELPEGFLLLYEGSPGKYRWGLHSTLCGAWLAKSKGRALRP